MKAITLLKHVFQVDWAQVISGIHFHLGYLKIIRLGILFEPQSVILTENDGNPVILEKKMD